MDWHIITGSKGGVGKTLISLLLLAYYLEEKSDESILVLDLNAMNTDTSALLLHGRNAARSVLFRSGGKNIILKKSFAMGKDFVIGYPVNPFQLFPDKDFAQLLSSVKKYSILAANKLAVNPFKHVIIDTNYHFCNIFSPQIEDYAVYQQGDLKDDNFTIWFLWVYRQLKKLLDERLDEKELLDEQTEGNEEKIKQQIEKQTARESQLFDYTIAAIETIFGGRSKIGPVVHTYAPAGLLPTDTEIGGFFANLFSFGRNSSRTDEDKEIDELANLEKLRNVGNYVGFSVWQEILQKAKKPNPESDSHQLFNDLLHRAVKMLSDDESLPVNIFPLSLFQPGLAGYTDRERPDAIANLAKMNIYRNFTRTLRRKYGEEYK